MARMNEPPQHRQKAIPGSTIKALREAQDISLQDLCDRIERHDGQGLNKATISRIENGIGNPSLDTLERIARALGVTPADLFHPPLLAPILALQEPARSECWRKVTAYITDLAAAYDAKKT